jgi:hypothetical protein
MDKKREASTLAMAERYSESAALGASALNDDDVRFTDKAAINRRIAAFSLFGANPAYCETIVLNAKLMPDVYPGWEMWVFHDDSVPRAVLERLRQAGCHLACSRDWLMSHWPGTFWRFAAVLIPGAQYVIFRDADSLVCQREQRLVEDWLSSGKPFHVIRDWYGHVDLILAGLWGAYAPFLGDMRARVDEFVSRGALHPTHADQEFLAEHVWPRIKDFALVHDSVHEGFGLDVKGFEAAQLSPNGKFALGSFLLTGLTFEGPLSGPVRFILRDEQGREVCAYDGMFENNRYEIELPYHHSEKIKTGEWKYELRFARAPA